MYTILQNNPYKLADDIPGVGFKMADEIAAKIGIVADSDFRIKSGILYTLYQATANGHTYLPEDELADRAAKLLQVEISEIDKHLMDMQMDKRLVIRERKKQKTAEMDVFVQAESAVSGQMQPQPDVLGEPNASNVSNM